MSTLYYVDYIRSYAYRDLFNIIQTNIRKYVDYIHDNDSETFVAILIFVVIWMSILFYMSVSLYNETETKTKNENENENQNQNQNQNEEKNKNNELEKLREKILLMPDNRSYMKKYESHYDDYVKTDLIVEVLLDVYDVPKENMSTFIRNNFDDIENIREFMNVYHQYVRMKEKRKSLKNNHKMAQNVRRSLRLQEKLKN